MQKIIAANWKMYKTRQEARETAAAVVAALNEQPTPHEVVVFAPFTAIAEVADAFAASQAQAGAQDVWPAVEGAFTGEISPRMLQDAGAVWVLTGHSERRHVLGESDELVGRKTAFALEQGLKVMLCIGEKLEERESGQLEDVLRRQLDSGLPAGGDALEGRFAVAYEPVWGHRYRQGRRSRRSAGHPRRGASPAVRALGRDRQQDPDPVWWERQTGQCR